VPAQAALAIAVLLLVLLASACARQPAKAPGTGHALTGTTPTPTPTSTPPPTRTPPPTPARALSARQLAGQRVIFGYRGLTPPTRLLSLISHGQVAGVIFFADNISSPTQLRAVARKLQRAAASPDNPVRAPLLLMVDQEGGRVRRLPGAPLLSERAIGDSADPPAAATRAGRDAGRNLRDIGLNVNLSPVLDVFRKQGNFDDRFGRSYSTDAQQVAVLGANFIRSQQRERVAATAKHFPGLGSADKTQNTDEGPVILPTSRDSLAAVDELPFKSAISARVKLVMVSWAIYPSLDPGLPAGLSSTVVQGRLREALGFKGVTVSDGIQADALDAFGTIGHRAELAAGAGMDLLICAKSKSSVTVGLTAMKGLEDAYLDGRLDRAAFRASVQRVIDLRKSLRN